MPNRLPGGPARYAKSMVPVSQPGVAGGAGVLGTGDGCGCVVDLDED